MKLRLSNSSFCHHLTNRFCRGVFEPTVFYLLKQESELLKRILVLTYRDQQVSVSVYITHSFLFDNRAFSWTMSLNTLGVIEKTTFI